MRDDVPVVDDAHFVDTPGTLHEQGRRVVAAQRAEIAGAAVPKTYTIPAPVHATCSRKLARLTAWPP